MKSVIKKIFALLLLVAFTGGAYYFYQRANEVPFEQRYRIQALEKGNITQSVSANGTLNPVVLVNVGTQVSGTVTKLYVDFNDKVEKGQILLELDQSLFMAQAGQSSANVRNAEASLELAKANEARIQSLFQKEYVSRHEYDLATQSRKSAQAQLAQAQAAAQKDQVNLGYTQIRSPVSGIVIDRMVDLGQTVAASLQTPTLIKIAQDLSEMRIDSSFAEADVALIKEGQRVTFTVDAFPNRTFNGEVQQIRLNPIITQNVVTYNVRVSLKNPDHILLPGMTAYVNIAVAQSNDVLIVPNAALRFKPSEESGAQGEATSTPAERSRQKGEGKGSGKGKTRDEKNGLVYVVEAGKLRPVNVRIGITDNRNTEIISGDIKPGDKVVVGETVTATVNKPSRVGFSAF